jgi:superfamily II DNA or RNA helicase
MSNLSLNSVVLRDYQTRTLDVLRGMFRAGLHRVVLYAPTGSGKTEMGIDMTRGARERERRVLFVANRVELVGQAWRRFHKSGITAGVIQADNTRGVDNPVIIGSIQTLARRGWPKFDLCIVDEAHGVAGSKDYQRFSGRTPRRSSSASRRRRSPRAWRATWTASASCSKTSPRRPRSAS